MPNDVKVRTLQFKMGERPAMFWKLLIIYKEPTTGPTHVYQNARHIGPRQSDVGVVWWRKSAGLVAHWPDDNWSVL